MRDSLQGTTTDEAVAPGMLHISTIRGLTALEEAFGQGPLTSWEDLLNADPFATFLQGPVWAMLWYRSYAGSFDPLVLMSERDGALVGVVPLAVEKSTGRLVFAGDQMGDYRDVVALPDCREEVLKALLALYREGRYPNMLHVGPTLPESNSVDLLLRICCTQGVRGIRRGHSGWRWWLDQAREAPDPLKKKSVHYKLNYFRKRGEVVPEVIAKRQDWDQFRDEFYHQHSLRQLASGRQLSFDNPEKRVFFDSLFDTGLGHVTILRVAGKTVASHYGCLWKDVLYLGAPAFDVREGAYSPGLLLIVLTMKRAQDWGMRGFDLTMGGGDLKERFSTTRVDLPSVDLYTGWWPYTRRRLLDQAISWLRRSLTVAGGDDDLWTKSVKPFVIQAADHARTALALGAAQGWRYLRESAFASWGGVDRRVSLEWRDQQRDRAPQPPPDHCFNRNQIYDFLKFDALSKGGLYYLRRGAAHLPQMGRGGDDLHTLVVQGKLVAWGFSRLASGKAPAKGDDVQLEPGTALLHGFQILPGPGLVAHLAGLTRHVAEERKLDGATRIQLDALNPSRTAEAAFLDAGFRLKRVETRMRFLKRERTRIRTVSD
jgi:CelD/BcsL family acetyltransferase involved in cellulose biosynthesis